MTKNHGPEHLGDLAYDHATMADLDGIDRALIDGLVADGRASYAALARRIDMSQAAVKARVIRLLDSGVIHILGRIDPRALGYGEFAYCLIDVEGPVAPVAERLAGMDEAAFVLILAGTRGLFVEFRASDAQHLGDAIERAPIRPSGTGHRRLLAGGLREAGLVAIEAATRETGDHRLGARRRNVDAHRHQAPQAAGRQRKGHVSPRWPRLRECPTRPPASGCWRSWPRRRGDRTDHRESWSAGRQRLRRTHDRRRRAG